MNGCRSLWLSKRSSFTDVALREKREKFTPSRSGVAPSG
jgi:hypothetical protein